MAKKKKISIKLYLFPWAGGTSRIYSTLSSEIGRDEEDQIPLSSSPESWSTAGPGSSATATSTSNLSFQVHPVDLPGRFVRPDEEAITDIPTLADVLITELFGDPDYAEVKQIQPYVLFGHSFGAMLAFEIAKKVEEKGMQPPLALFVSASRPPSAASLTSSDGLPVSDMDLSEMASYFKARGSTMNFDFGSKELSDAFVRSVKVDYKGLESYTSNPNAKVSCPLFAIGGDSDSIVAIDDTSAWKSHHEGDDGFFEHFILAGKGHFYLLDDNDAARSLVGIIVQNVQSVFDARNQEMVETIKDLFAKVLDVDQNLVLADSDFFELGGSSLDIIALITQIKSTVGIHITQNEFFLNPRVDELAIRVNEIKESSSEMPQLEPIVGSSDRSEWFHASPGQEQMLSLWENAPAMYNMPTTIEFTHAPVDVASMKRAFTSIVQQQPSLRTILAMESVSNTVNQKVLPCSRASECFQFVEIDVNDEEEARSVIEAESLFEFLLSRPPVVRGVLVRVNNNSSSFLLLNQHHVGSDGWSRTVFRRQLLQVYIAICSEEGLTQRNSVFIPSHPNYVDWTLWLRRWLLDYGQQEKQLQYWKDKLQSLPVLDLPTDRARPTILSSRGKRLPITIDSELTQRFSSLVVSKGANLYTGLIALYMLMLHRMGGGDDFAIGIALANRHHEGLQHLIGYFANEVAIRANFEKSATFVDLLKMIRENVLEGMANADVPFHKVTEALRVSRDSSRTSVFQAMFALQERDWHSVDDLNPKEGNIHFKLKQFNHNTSKFEVHLQLRHDGSDGLEGDLHIATDLFTAQSGERMVAMYKNLMQSCIDTPVVPIRFHDITTQSDKDIVKASNDTLAKFNRFSILELRSEPDATAFIADGPEVSRTTYGEFKILISSVSSFLLSEVSVQRQDRVGLLIKSSPKAIAAIFGVINAGCTVVILDPEKTPLERCDMIFDDASVNVALVDIEFQDKFHDLKIDNKRKLANLQSVLEYDPESPVDPSNVNHDDVFGIFYTSGTTGIPKGVIITHRNVANLVTWWKTFFELKNMDRVLLFSSLSFIMSLRQYIPTICAGATVVFSRSSIDFESAIVAGKVNKLVCTPSALAALDIDLVASGIDMVQVAGEAPRKGIMTAWKSRVNNLYIGLGPTELCAHAICGEFDGETICLGYPAANVRAYIVDSSTGIQSPVNVPGELWVAGENVSSGYLNQKKLTDQSFTTDPFSSSSSSSSMRLYKTGDLAKRLPDGRIQFIGRGDNQLKVNGFRIEAGEIVNAVPSDVTNAHAMVRNGALELFITPSNVDVQAVRSHMRKKVPTYMVPSVVHAIDSFPLNKNRKLDVSAMISIVDAQSTSIKNADERDPTPDTETARVEKTIRLIWAQSLGLNSDDILRDDNFFELGGTSLSAVMVSRVMSKELQAEISVHDVFVYQSVQSLAAFIGQSCQIDGRTDDPTPLHFLPGGREVLNPVLFTLLQAFGLLLMSIIVTVPVIATVSISVRSFIWFGDLGVVLFPLFLICGCLLHILLAVASKWIIIGRYRPGKAKVFSWMFLKWWLVRRVLQVTRLYTWIFDETSLSRVFFFLLGATVGKNVSVEQPYLLEPDLVHIGDNCVVDFEVQFATSEIRNGVLELRRVHVEDNVKLGVRSVLLGGTFVHKNCEVGPKATVDYFTSTSAEGQLLIGSPAKIDNENKAQDKLWRPERGLSFTLCQCFGCVAIIQLMTGIVFVGASIGRLINGNYGSIGLVIYLGSLFQIISCLLWLGTVALLKQILIPVIVPGRVYSGAWFCWRKWFLDRIFLSPLFAYASQRTLQTSSTFPWYMSLLGAKIGKKTWINHPYLRVGVELISIGDEFHMGMLSYFSTEKHTSDGVSFLPISVGEHTSFGQRCVALGGVTIGSFVTVGAETILPSDFCANEGGTAFGSPPVLFTSTAQYKDIVQETQLAAKAMVEDDKNKDSVLNAFPVQLQSTDKGVRTIDAKFSSGTKNSVELEKKNIRTSVDKEAEKAPSRMQDIGSGKYFWLYVITMILIQSCLPLIIGAAYGLIYFGMMSWFGNIRFEVILATIPLIYILGSVVLMFIMKLMHLGGGSFSTGTANFFSFRFFYWHIFADMVYLCTSTIIYPFSGTELYCTWLRIMGAKIGKRVFISPENGGFREIDFLDIGDDCCLMTPNIHAHYTDHGVLQFCPVKLEDGCEINPGSTLMPLTRYGKHCRLRPFAVTVKGQHCEERTEYNGNPCKAVKSLSEKVAVLFGGQGAQYPGMLENLINNRSARELLEIASETLSMNIKEICSPSSDAKAMQDTRITQIIVFVADLMAAEVMRQKVAVDFNKVVACAGFSLGEMSALCFSGAISFNDSLRLVKTRADAMAEASGDAMCNIKGLSRKNTEALCSRFCCQIANVICCDRVDGDCSNNVYVLAGTTERIDFFVNHICNDVEAGNGVTARKLRTSGAFHSTMMKKAQAKFRRVLATIKITFPENYLVYSNVTGLPYRSEAEIRKLLPLQLISPVQWCATMTDLTKNEGVDKFIECGPSDTLSKMVKLILPEIAEGRIMTSDIINQN